MIKDIQQYQPLLSVLQNNLTFANYSISINKEYKFCMGLNRSSSMPRIGKNRVTNMPICERYCRQCSIANHKSI